MHIQNRNAHINKTTYIQDTIKLASVYYHVHHVDPSGRQFFHLLDVWQIMWCSRTHQIVLLESISLTNAPIVLMII